MKDKRYSIRVTEVPEGKEKENGAERVFERNMAENLPNLAKEANLQTQETVQVPYRINPRKSTPNAS